MLFNPDSPGGWCVQVEGRREGDWRLPDQQGLVPTGLVQGQGVRR